MPCFKLTKSSKRPRDEPDNGGVRRGQDRPQSQKRTSRQVADINNGSGYRTDTIDNYSTRAGYVRHTDGGLTVYSEDAIVSSHTDYKRENDKLIKQLVTKNEEVCILQERLQKCLEERDDYRNRLSQQESNRLTNNNPAIVDLGDPNRPLKLVERFSELYDNQWTDAFEELTDNNVKDRVAIKQLFQILKIIFEYCSMLSRRQWTGLEDTIKTLICTNKLPEQMSANMKLYKDERKKNYKQVLPNILEEVIVELGKHNIAVRQTSKVSLYVKEAVPICWLMNIQDPPMVIDFSEHSSAKFDKDRFREYTKTGNKIKFVVWPVLHQYMDGPVMTKGVAEGKRKKQKSQTKDERGMIDSLLCGSDKILGTANGTHTGDNCNSPNTSTLTVSSQPNFTSEEQIRNDQHRVHTVNRESLTTSYTENGISERQRNVVFHTKGGKVVKQLLHEQSRYQTKPDNRALAATQYVEEGTRINDQLANTIPPRTRQHDFISSGQSYENTFNSQRNPFIRAFKQ